MRELDGQVVVVLVIEALDGLEERISELVSSGYEIFEVTLRTNCAFDAIKLIKKKFPAFRIGAGTVLTLEQLEECIEVGADFGVAPGLNPIIVKAAQAKKLPFIPGIATPSELDLALSLGLSLVKVFPAKLLGGVDYLKALSGPYQSMKFMPTGGVSEANYRDYLALPSVSCVGGTWMNSK